jgi:hypothetical protein
MANRGSLYNTGHTDDVYNDDGKLEAQMIDLNPELYWDFTHYDLSTSIAAVIDSVYDETGKKISYVGYDLGTTSVLAGLTMKETLYLENPEQAEVGEEATETVAAVVQHDLSYSYGLLSELFLVQPCPYLGSSEVADAGTRVKNWEEFSSLSADDSQMSAKTE